MLSGRGHTRADGTNTVKRQRTRAQQGVLVVADTGNATLRSVESPLSDVGRMRTVAGVTGTRGTADGWEAKFNTTVVDLRLNGTTLRLDKVIEEAIETVHIDVRVSSKVVHHK